MVDGRCYWNVFYSKTSAQEINVASENFDFKFTFKFLFALSKEPGSCTLLAIKIWLPRLHVFSLHQKIRPRPTVQSVG